MLNAHVTESGEAPSRNGKPFWIDLLNPTSEERDQIAADYGIKVPLRESLQEIETSSRLRADGGLLYVSMPLSLDDEVAGFAPVPLGFVLSSELLDSALLGCSRVRPCRSRNHIGTARKQRGVRGTHRSDGGFRRR